jgi:hypothetical protein
MPGLAAILRARCPWSFRLRALVEPGGPPASGMVGLTDYPAALRGHASSGTGWLSISGRGHGAQAIRVICRRPCAAEGGQDSHVQEDPEGSGRRVGDRVRGAESGRGGLGRGQGAGQQCRPGRPAMARAAPARGRDAEYGRADPGRDQPGSRAGMAGCDQDEAAAGKIQGRRGEQHGGDQPPACPAGRGWGCCPAIRRGGLPRRLLAGGRASARDRVVLVVHGPASSPTGEAEAAWREGRRHIAA